MAKQIEKIYKNNNIFIFSPLNLMQLNLTVLGLISKTDSF
jgi:hypothetical protein